MAVMPHTISHHLCRLLTQIEDQVVVTTQLATKFLNPDGTPANYDSGSRAILVPQLGKPVQPFVTYTDKRIN